MSHSHFNLAGLNVSETLDVSGALDSEAYVAPVADCDALLTMTVADAQALFKFQTDALDVSNIATSDITYDISSANWTVSSLGDAATEGSYGPSGSTTALAGAKTQPDGTSTYTASGTAQLKHDFIRHIASELFNTVAGVDLFNNENELVADVVSKGDDANTAIKAILDSADGETSLSADGVVDDADSNIGNELMKQMIHAVPGRFASLSDSNAVQSFPLIANDTLEFVLTMNAAANQKDLTSATAVNARTYRVIVELQ